MIYTHSGEMAEQRKRLSKKASKILFQIICEDSFEGNNIKTALPATRRISKAREGLWEYIRSELTRRSEEEYDIGTVSAAWYYNLRKIGSCLDQIDTTEDGGVTLEKMRTLEKYVCKNLGDRIRGRGRVKGEDDGEKEEDSGKEDGNEKGEGDGDVKLTKTQMVTLSRQSTMDATVNYSFDVVTLKSMTVKNERGSSNEEKVNQNDDPSVAAKGRDRGIEDIEMREEDGMENDVFDPLDLVDTPPMEISHGCRLNSVPGGVRLSMGDPPPPSRYNTAETTPISRDNSSMSVSGYDADNEKGLIKRRRKELKKRGGREREIKVEEEEEEEIEKENDGTGEKDDEEEGEEMEDEDREEEGDGGEERNEKRKMLDSLKGMIENLRDHIVSLRIIGAVDGMDMETLADSFENAGKSIINNKDIL